MKYLFLFCLLLSILSTNQQKPINYFDSWDYLFNGTCPTNQSICLPFSNISFSYIWTNISEAELISDGNEFIKNSPLFKKKLHIDRSRSWFQTNLGLFLDEKINENETIAEFTIEETYSSLLDLFHYKNMPYYERDMAILSKLNLSKDSSLVQLGLMLLYHFYHFEDSPLKSDLRLFPQKPIAPLVLFTSYEIELLQKDEAYNSIMEMRQHYINSFIVLHNKIVDSKLSEEEFQIFFNRTRVNFDDWTYVFSLIYCYSIYDIRDVDGKREEISFIPPILRLVVENKERDQGENKKKTSNWKRKNDNVFEFQALGTLLKNDEILVESQNTQHDIWLNMGFLVKRPDNCITINLVPKDIEETFKIPGYHCVKITDEFLLNKVYLTGNLINMEEKDLKKCKKKLEKEQNLSDERRMEILFNECKHPKWKKANLFKGILKEIDVRLKSYEPAALQAENVGIRRIKDGASPDLVLQIRDYLKWRIHTCNDILSYVRQLKKINKRLNNLNDLDRKKIKEALEEETDRKEEEIIEKELKEEL